MAAHNLDQARRFCLDRAHEADRSRGMGERAMNTALARAQQALDDVAAFLLQIQTAQAEQHGVDITGDLVLADKLAATQQRWNAGQVGDAMDALLEAYGHMRKIQVDLLDKRGAA